MQAYVDKVGRRVLAVTPVNAAGVRFVLLDTDVANAFVVPGATIFITRGLLAWLNSEAELAAVIAHEAGHLSEDHAAESRRVQRAAEQGAVVAGLFDRDAAEERILRYSREQELEADRVGFGFLVAAGYAGRAVLESQNQFDAGDRAGLLLRGLPPELPDQATAMETHPSSSERRAALEALGASATEGEEGRAAYLAAIDGLPFGPNGQDWQVEGTRVIHPGAGITFPRPAGFALASSNGAVSGSGPDSNFLIVDFAARAPSMRPEDYMALLFAQFGEPIVGLRQAGGLSSAAVAFRYTDEASDGYAVAGAVALADDVLLRVLVVGRPGHKTALRAAYDTIVEGLRRGRALTAAPRPVLTTHVVAAGETVAGLARGMAAPYGQSEVAEPLLRELNGLALGEALTPGLPIKLLQ